MVPQLHPTIRTNNTSCGIQLRQHCFVLVGPHQWSLARLTKPAVTSYHSKFPRNVCASKQYGNDHECHCHVYMHAASEGGGGRHTRSASGPRVNCTCNMYILPFACTIRLLHMYNFRARQSMRHKKKQKSLRAYTRCSSRD